MGSTEEVPNPALGSQGTPVSSKGNSFTFPFFFFLVLLQVTNTRPVISKGACIKLDANATSALAGNLNFGYGKILGLIFP
jgi:hypothetical protein